MISRASSSRSASMALFSAGVAVLLATPLAAQGYKRTQGDTLRYREVTETDVSGGFAPGQGRREATVAVTFLGGDNATAWFDAYAETSKFGEREMTVPAAAVVNKPMNLQLAANGAVELPPQAAQGPGGPSPLARFFVKLPASPLAVGTEWADTTIARPMGRGPATPELLVIKYKVVKDTTGPAGKSVIIEAKGDVTSKTTTPGENAAEIEVKNSASEKGRIVFAVDQGRMISWDRTVEYTTKNSVRGGIKGVGGAAVENNRTVGTVRGRVDMSAPEARSRDTKTRIHTLIQLVGPAEAKATPAK